MIKLADLPPVFGLSSVRIKQLIDEIIKNDPSSHQLHKGTSRNSHLSVQHHTVRCLLNDRNKDFEKRVITVAALKGGIGKTFLSINIAVRAAMLGAKVLIVDLDPESCATNSLLHPESDVTNHHTILEVFKGIISFKDAIIKSKYDGLDIIPAALRVSSAEKIVRDKNPKWLLKKNLQELNYDYIFFELPPSFSTLNSAAYLASDLVVIPCTPNIHSLESVSLTIESINEVAKEFEGEGVEFKIVFNMSNASRNATKDVLSALYESYKDMLLPFHIKESADIQNAVNAGLTIFETKCATDIREDMDKLVLSLCPIIDKPVADKITQPSLFKTTNQTSA